MNELVNKEIAELIKTSDNLARLGSQAGSELPNERVQELLGVAARGGQLIRRLYGKDSQYDELYQKILATQNFSWVHSNHYSHISEMAGLFKAIESDIKSGMLLNVRSLLQAEIFSDFLEMAEHLLAEGYKDASAVLLGAVMEDALRKLAETNGLPITREDQKPLTIEPINVSLAKAGIYGPLVKKQVTTWANLRNDAAHGHFEKYDTEQVKQMMMFVQKFCADFLK